MLVELFWRIRVIRSLFPLPPPEYYTESTPRRGPIPADRHQFSTAGCACGTSLVANSTFQGRVSNHGLLLIGPDRCRPVDAPQTSHMSIPFPTGSRDGVEILEWGYKQGSSAGHI